MTGTLARVGRREMSADFFWGRLEERQHFEDLGIDGTIILQWIGRRGLG